LRRTVRERDGCVEKGAWIPGAWRASRLDRE
jgi:hypothetical protein